MKFIELRCTDDTVIFSNIALSLDALMPPLDERNLKCTHFEMYCSHQTRYGAGGSYNHFEGLVRNAYMIGLYVFNGWVADLQNLSTENQN